jgi:hypothetical protein
MQIRCKGHNWSFTYLVITLFKPIAVFCGTANILQNGPHIHPECEEHSTKYCQSPCGSKLNEQLHIIREEDLYESN